MAATYTPGFVRTRSGRGARFKGGYGDGGLVFLPPPLNTSDYATLYEPPGVSQGRHHVVATKVWWGAGIAEPRAGNVQQGWTWGEGSIIGYLTYDNDVVQVDVSTVGWLLFRQHTLVETEIQISNRFALDSLGRILWAPSGSSMWGALTHANVAALAPRGYPFP